MKLCILFLILYCLPFKSCCEDEKAVERVAVVLVHGGAGDIPFDRHPRTLDGVKAAANLGYKVLMDGGSVVDAVESAVRSMEDNEMFNAGYGSVLNLGGEVEMDASIMVGSNLSAGGVTIVQNVANPISLARLVMERTPHILLGARGAELFAQSMNISMIPPGGLVTLYSLELLKNLTKDSTSKMNIGGTVGCVAIDKHGHLAAATSTGGLNGKMVGRCSDSSQIGSGTYADDASGAVSSTGHGESISKYGLAREIVNQMGYGTSATEAVHLAIEDLTDYFKNGVGAIALSKTGEVGLDFSTAQMPWAYRKGDHIFYGIEPKQNTSEKLS